MQLANLLQARNSVLNTEIYSKWKKLFSVDVNSYVIGFLWGHNCRNVCSFPGTVLYLPEWSVEEAEWPALTGCASGLIIAVLVGKLLLCPIWRTNSPYKLLLPPARSWVFQASDGLDALYRCLSSWAQNGFVSLRLWISGASCWLPTCASFIPTAHSMACHSDPRYLSWLQVASRSACQRLYFLFLRMFFFLFLFLVLHSFVFGEGICLLPYSEDSSDVSTEAIIRASSNFPICLAAQDKQPCLQTTPSLNSLWILLQMTGHLCVSRASDFCCP